MMRQVSAQLPFNKDDVVIQSSALSKTSALRAMNGRKYILLYTVVIYCSLHRDEFDTCKVRRSTPAH